MDNDIFELYEIQQFEQLIQGLMDNNYGCCNDFINTNTTAGLRANMHNLSKAGNMNAAGIGNKTNLKKDPNFRGDKINWISEQSTNEFEMVYLRKIERFILYLNETCFTSVLSFESHYAIYPIKSVYKRHIDQFKNQKGRKFSIVLYLNEDWTEADGGKISLYPKDAAQIDISPLGGRMVFFRSDEMEHEVHASFTRSRRSIAAWLKD